MFCRGRQFISGFPGPLRFDLRWALPLPNLGFSLAGLASFHLDVAIKLVSVARLWALGHEGPSPSVARYRTWGYFFPHRNHYRHHRRCEHGLSSPFGAAIQVGYIVF